MGRGDLLDEQGALREPGWAPEQRLRWNAQSVRRKEQLREWDFFSLMTGDVAVMLTMARLGFADVCTVSVVDLHTSEKVDVSRIGVDIALSSGASGQATCAESALRFSVAKTSAEITVDLPASVLGPRALGSIRLTRDAAPYLSLATPFRESAALFFFEQKIPLWRGEGELTVGDRRYDLSGARGVMDWGRGAWPARAMWRWAVVDGDGFALNLGEGFGDPRFATENLLIARGRAVKLGTVSWERAGDEWRFVGDGVDIVLHEEATETAALALGERHQRTDKGYGRFTGTVTAGGERWNLQDARGFAEEVDLSW